MLPLIRHPFLLFFIVATLFHVATSNTADEYDDAVDDDGVDQPPTTFKLNNSVSIPLIGMGIGNLAHESIPAVVKNQLGLGVQLIDTAHASNNEKILAEAIASFDNGGGSRSNTRGGHAEELPPVHVVTKVWYTYLGYERTKLSVKESLQALEAANTRQVYVHMLLHWPWCDDDVPWMNCEEEEKNLPQSVKDTGPAPHLKKSSAFLESWKALEDMYKEHMDVRDSRESGEIHPPILASIGVSNFEQKDMEALLKSSHIPPQIYQGNSWKIFHDPYMFDLLRKHGIHFQAYSVMSGILSRRNNAPNAYNMLTEMAREILDMSDDKDLVVTEATVLLAFMVSSSVGIIPRASSSPHQVENSPDAIAAVLPLMNESHIRDLELAIPALMKGEDVHIDVTFMNGLKTPIQIHWLNPETKEEVLVSNIIHPGSMENQRSHPGHTFVAYDPDRLIRREFTVDKAYGDPQHFKVDEDEL